MSVDLVYMFQFFYGTYLERKGLERGLRPAGVFPPSFQSTVFLITTGVLYGPVNQMVTSLPY